MKSIITSNLLKKKTKWYKNLYDGLNIPTRIPNTYINNSIIDRYNYAFYHSSTFAMWCY